MNLKNWFKYKRRVRKGPTTLERYGSACDKGYEASPYTNKALLPLRACPTCKGTGYVEVYFK